jgi:hypothetical protein
MGRDALHPAPRQMNTLATQIQELAAVLSNAEEVVAAFQALRDACSDEQWDELCSCPPVDALLSACCELEEALDT